MIKFHKVKNDAIIPKRQSKGSAGYDFYINEDFTIAPHEVKIVKTGIKAEMPSDVVLLIYIRSSVSIKRQVMLANNVAVIDADYYNNIDNEGEIGITFYNYGTTVQSFNKGERLAQGIFVKYLTTIDDSVDTERTGGVGSTGK